ncbi:uridine kinase [Asanoa ferruginea]|uniref:Uridine kinase n=1 Tax=Asanoa ferruginea TaxID=53367 RepID=A0A3D9ZD44_9ACTN|nr:AAA family ATPase [Asanoa ferruginea]REF94372.1 uridine kinase [Asanoa ferruginea]GIF51112.1 uridine kinase [Asanoa ferruginea]
MSLFVAVTGGTGSGKTTLAGSLSARLGADLSVLSLDDLVIGRAALAAAGRTVVDWDDPALWRWDDLRAHLADLKAGRPTVVDARSRESRAAGFRERRVVPRKTVLLVGHLALHDAAVARSFDVRVYLDLPEEELIRRRLGRPPAAENREPYLTRTLLPAHRRLVVPQRARATHVVDATGPPEAVADAVAAIIRAAS